MSLDSLLVALTQSRVQQLVAATETHREELVAAQNAHVATASASWMAAATRARNHFELVLRNNPGKTVEEVLETRPDIAEALSVPFAEAAVTTHQAIDDAWVTGSGLGGQHAAQQLGILDIEPRVRQAIEPAYLWSLHQDVEANADEARNRLTAALLADDGVGGRFDRELADLERRSRYSTQVAATRAYGRATEATYTASGRAAGQVVRKLWVTRFGPGTCPTCAALHGSLAVVGRPFDPQTTFRGRPPRVYRDLRTPPRHPNCRCLLVPWVDSLESDSGPNPTTMAEWARRWFLRTVAAVARALRR